MAEPQSVAHTEHVGAVLARTREERGLKLEDVCVALKLTAARVAALEAGHFSSVGAPIYVRGFVRSYARLLDLPERSFDARLQEYFDQLEPQLVPSLGTRRSVNWGERYSWAFSYLVGTALVLTLIWTVIGFDSDTQLRGQDAGSNRSEPASQIIDSSDTSSTDQLFAADLETADATAVAAVDAPAPVVQSHSGTGNAQAPVMASLSPFRADSISAERGFVLNLAGKSWTEVHDSRGVRVVYDTLSEGTHRIEGQPPFTVLLGNAGAAQLSSAGQAIDVTPFMRANVARFKLEASGGQLQASEVAPR